MKIKFSSLLFVAIVAFGGCASIFDDIRQKDPIPWRPYLENNESLEEIAFSAFAGSDHKNPRMGDLLGIAEMKVKNGGGYTKSLIGSIYSYGDDYSLIVINADSNGHKIINMRDRVSIDTLKTSKKIKFYDFGGGILETIVYSAKEPVCVVFNSGKKVDARSVTNYYLKNNDEFFAAIVNANISPSGYEIKNLDYKFFGNPSDLKEVMEAIKSEEFKTKVINKDLQKQVRLLKNILCVK